MVVEAAAVGYLARGDEEVEVDELVLQVFEKQAVQREAAQGLVVRVEAEMESA